MLFESGIGVNSAKTKWIKSRPLALAACASMALGAFVFALEPGNEAHSRGGTAKPATNSGGGSGGDGSRASGGGSGGGGGTGGGGNKVGTLAGVKPLRADTSNFIRNPEAAAQLGKALFWDIQAGSDGQACASCHFHSGADVRVKHQVNPGFDAAARSNPQYAAFDPRKSDRTPMGPNVELNAGDFPLKTYADPAHRNSKVTYETANRFGSSNE